MMCVKIWVPKKNTQNLKVTLAPPHPRWKSPANRSVTINPNKIECVNPLCANTLDDGSIHNEKTKSPSGIDWASAPSSKAFLPMRFVAISSPIQAPKAKWVIESKLMI